MIIAVVAIKGGTGKTTAAVHLAASIAATGQTVAIIDADPQGSALDWCARSAAPWPVVATGTGEPIPDTDHTIIDTPPGHPEIVAEALAAADIALIPLRPTRADIAQLPDTLALVATGNAKAKVLLNQVFARTIAARTTAELLAAQPDLEVVGRLAHTQALANAYGEPINPETTAEVWRKLNDRPNQSRRQTRRTNGR